jgi:hypothetical protein
MRYTIKEFEAKKAAVIAEFPGVSQEAVRRANDSTEDELVDEYDYAWGDAFEATNDDALNAFRAQLGYQARKEEMNS